MDSLASLSLSLHEYMVDDDYEEENKEEYDKNEEVTIRDSQDVFEDALGLPPDQFLHSSSSKLSIVESDQSAKSALFPEDFCQVPDLNEIWESSGLSKMEKTQVPLQRYGNIEETFENCMSRIQQHFSVETVMQEVRMLLAVLVIVQKNESALKVALDTQNNKNDQLYKEFKNDKRVKRALELANGWRKRLATSQEESESLLVKVKNVKDEAASLQEKITYIMAQRQKLDGMVHSCVTMSNAFAEAQLEKKQAEAQLETLKSTIEKLQNKQTDPVAEYNICKEENVVKEIQIVNLKLKNRQQNEKSKKLLEDQQELLTELTKLKINWKRTQRELSDVTEELSAMVNKLSIHRGEKYKMRRDNQELTVKHGVCDETLKAVQTRLKVLEAERRSVEKEMNQLKIENKNALLLVKQRDAQIDQLKNKIAASQKKTYAQESKIETFKNIIREPSEEMAAFTPERTKRGSGSIISRQSGTPVTLATPAVNFKTVNIFSHRRIKIDWEKKRSMSKSTAALDALEHERRISYLETRLEQCKKVVYAKNMELEEDKQLILKERERNETQAKHIRQLKEHIKKTERGFHLKKSEILKDEKSKSQIDKDRLFMIRSELDTDQKVMFNMNRENERLIIRNDVLKSLVTSGVQKIDKLKSELYFVKADGCQEDVGGSLRAVPVYANELKKCFATHEADVASKSHQLHSMRNQRNIFGVRLIQRNTEIDLLKMKIRVMDQVIRNGRISFEKAVSQVDALNIKVAALRQQLRVCQGHLIKVNPLKDKLIKTTKKLTNAELIQRSDCDYMSTKLHPLQDIKLRTPSKYELILKTQALTRSLIVKVNRVAEYEMELHRKNEFVAKVTAFLRRRVDPTLTLGMLEARQAMSAKSRSLKALTAEYNMSQTELGHAKATVRVLKTRLKKGKTVSIKVNESNPKKRKA